MSFGIPVRNGLGVGLMASTTLSSIRGSAYDPDAQAYITAVETADAQALEDGVKTAINSFVVGCKSDGIWNAIKASCILAGARTLTGALVPLKGTAPTNFNFVPGDYDRATGLQGGTAGKTLDSNRNNNADPQDSNHNAAYPTFVNVNAPLMGTQVGITGANAMFTGGTRNRSTSSIVFPAAANANALVGHSRGSAANYTQRANGASTLQTNTSQTPQNANVTVFGYVAATSNTSRIAFYSIGENLDLALLDARVTTLINAYGAPTISGPLTAFTAGLAGSTSATVSPSGTAVTIISVTNGGVSDTLAAHNVVHDGFGTFTTTGAIL